MPFVLDSVRNKDMTLLNFIRKRSLNLPEHRKKESE